MHETVWLGRGGQGAFTAARLLGIAAMLSGKQAMAMPSFGPERRGAPVFAYTRIDDAKVHDRSTAQKADAAVILDGRIGHAMLLEIFTKAGVGTLVRAG